jgi:hypothetical protein
MVHTGATYLRSLGGESVNQMQQVRYSVQLETMTAQVSGDVPRLATGEWHHLCGVYDGATVSVYLNCATNDCGAIAQGPVLPANQPLGNGVIVKFWRAPTTDLMCVFFCIV